jgi:UDP-N-acetylmuramoyl-L-alanyl-D-glutamate--2,6-diaminopimelate ligase
MRLSELLTEVPAMSGALLLSDPEVRGVAHDSRAVEPGDLFVALVGQRFDGRAFAPAAVERGAVAVAGPDPAPAGVSVPWVPVEDPRSVLGPLSAVVYGHPDQELVLVGVTGTNGKSTVATLVSAILDAADLPAGFIGTLGYRFQDRTFPGGHTTPEASDLFRTLRRMRDAGARAVAMEVSSHALDMGRAAGATFDAAVFTNLSRDHLDFHPDMESYFQAKRRLFGMLKPDGKAVVNVEDEYGKRLASEIPAVTFGEGGDVQARNVEMTASGTRGVLVTPRGELPFSTPLLGRYNLLNLLAAAATAEALNVPHAAVAAALAAQRPVPGRLEPVDRGQPFPVFVDYAHTDAALDAAVRSVREIAKDGKVAVVFGCGGDRDRGKRPLMGRVVGELAELPILTSDNPRSEDPLAILAAIEEGVKASGNSSYRLVPDRREAIREAIASAGPGWAVLVAGKGHEREQIVGDRKIPFSDFEEIEKALEERLWHV